MSIPPVLKDRFYSWKDRSQTVSTDTHNIKILSTANTMLFPGSCEMMTFPLNFSLQIAALQEAPLSITLQYYLQIFFEKKNKIYPYTYWPPLLSVTTMPVLNFLLLSFSLTILYPTSINKIHPRYKHIGNSFNSEK